MIGNGPSLKAEQLDKLKDEVTFGVNRIHLIYNQTKWRPTYWVMQDFSNSHLYREDVDFHSRQGYDCYIRSDIMAKFLEWCMPRFAMRDDRVIPATEYMSVITQHLFVIERCNHIDCERFTSDGWHEPLCQMGGSVPSAIQIAVWMDYNPIYLIGMDGDKQGNAENNFIAGYIDVDNVTVQKAMIANKTTELALRIAERECGDRGVKLIDATVGGSAYNALPEVDFYDL